MDWYWAVALSMLSAVVSAAFFVFLAYKGVQGVLWPVTQKVKELDIQVTNAEGNISKLYKKLAADKSVEVRQSTQTLQQEAAAHLLQGNYELPLGKPKVYEVK